MNIILVIVIILLILYVNKHSDCNNNQNSSNYNIETESKVKPHNSQKNHGELHLDIYNEAPFGSLTNPAKTYVQRKWKPLKCSFNTDHIDEYFKVYATI